jgi:predicted transcriptional regulator
MEKPELRITPKKYTDSSTVISARFPKDLVKAIDSIATVTGRTRNEILQMCLEFSLQHMKIEGHSVELDSEETEI